MYAKDLKPRKWAKCYARECPNTNMSLEHFHSDLKVNYLEGRRNHRLDSLIYQLSQKMKSDVTARFRTIALLSYSKRDLVIQAQHNAAQEIPSDDVTMESDGVWRVTSQSPTSTEIYTVKLLSMCNELLCLRCRTCNICVHMVHCTCLFYTRHLLCKHIHVCCTRYAHQVKSRFGSRLENKGELDEVGQLMMITQIPDSHVANECAVNALANMSPALGAYMRNQLLSYPHRTPQTPRPIPGVENTPNGLRQVSVTPRTSIPHNKNIIHQRERYGIKRKRTVLFS